jgi:hypothetical protein
MTTINKTVREQQVYAAQNRAEGEVDVQNRLEQLHDALASVWSDIRLCDNGGLPQLGCMSEEYHVRCVAQLELALADLRLCLYNIRRGD